MCKLGCFLLEKSMKSRETTGTLEKYRLLLTPLRNGEKYEEVVCCVCTVCGV